MQVADKKPSTPFLKIEDAAKFTGLSRYYLRQGCKSGEVPHVTCGNRYMVNVPALLRQLGAEEA